jgi:hypothetical protein
MITNELSVVKRGEETEEKLMKIKIFLELIWLFVYGKNYHSWKLNWNFM